ncbi:MAG: retroviral-like aspartic protease family protein [Arenicellaceae bacterium]|nr:retroviral-like aspartic protease family protein [Arenicellaceae bacterium]
MATGALLTALDQKFLERITAPDTGWCLSLQTANGLTESIAYEIRLLCVGRTQVHNFEVAGLDSNECSRFDRLLGMDFLNMFSYTIDNSNNTLMLTPN